MEAEIPTIGAIGGNNEGFVGVNTYDSGFKNFFIGKGLDDTVGWSLAGIIMAMNQCKVEGAGVISTSFEDTRSNDIFKNAVKTLHENGVLLVAPAGNGGESLFTCPSSYDHVMSVAAVDSSRNIAWFSQYNTQVEISGPGVDVQSTWPGSIYLTNSGTAMACSHVAGVAGLVWSHFPDCKPMQIRFALSRTAVPPNGQSRSNINYGHGIVDAKAAYDFIKKYPCSSSS